MSQEMKQPKHMPYPVIEHKVRVACLDEKALAYAWIEAYAEQLSGAARPDDEEEYGSQTVTAEELIDTAMTHINESRWGGDYLNKGPLLEGESTDPMFWEKLAILKGIEIPESVQGNFFSCSC